MRDELLQTSKTEDILLGLPLKEAVELIEKAGLTYNIENYSSLRGIEGADDLRVLRARINNGCAYLIVSAFITEI